LNREQIDKYLQPILSRINADLAKKLAVPTLQTPAQAATPRSSSLLGLFSFGAKYNEAWKRAEQNFTGSEKYTFKSSTLTEMPSSVTGTIDISDVDLEIKERLVSTIKTEIWESAFVLLPTVSTSPELKYSRVTVAASLVRNGKSLGATRWADWQKGEGWKGRNGELESTHLFFPLMGFGIRGDKIEEYSIDVETVIERDVFPPTIVRTRFSQQLSPSTMVVYNPSEQLRFVHVDGSALSLDGLGQPSLLEQVEISLTAGTVKENAIIAPYVVNGVPTRPKPVVWVLPAEEMQKARCELTFKLRNGLSVKRPYKSDGGGHLLIRVTDSDWEG
jgi:hypothetical protein